MLWRARAVRALSGYEILVISRIMVPSLKADLHVHSYHSGYASHMRFLRARDSYSDVFEIYRVARARGMDLVCLTDHDRIDGCLEFLDRYPHAPDFLMGEEIECYLPDAPGLRVHLGAIGVTESIHREVQRLRPNVFETAAYLRSQDVFFGLNHLFLLYEDELPLERYLQLFMTIAPALETRNGAALAADNRLVEAIAGAWRASGTPIGVTGGSDAHTLMWVGTTYTEAQASTREAFLAELRAGRATVGGAHGGLWRQTSEIYGAIFNYWRALAGLERHDLPPLRRLGGSAFSLAAMPIQFVPAAIAARLKMRERRRVARYAHEWERLYIRRNRLRHGFGAQAGVGSANRRPESELV
jgi:predicted metal-dependent phosphoesterase TrpH